MFSRKNISLIVTVIALIFFIATNFFHVQFGQMQGKEVGGVDNSNTRVIYNQEFPANEEIINAAQEAEKYIYFAVYIFTRDDIKDAIIGAKLRGIDIKGVVDREQLDKNEKMMKIVNELRKSDIPIKINDHSGIMHLKVLVTDKKYISGSFNWTTAATKVNDEVLEIGTNAELRDIYKEIVIKLFNRY